MNLRNTLLLVLLGSTALSGFGHGQSLADLLSEPGMDLSRPADRARIVARMATIEVNRRQAAITRAQALGLPVRSVLVNGRVQEIADFDSVGSPLYLTTDNINAAISTGVNLLRSAPYSLSGAGVTIGLWDGGSARATHQEFGSRLTVMDGAATIDHATHVGGTLIASGVVAAARGMADAATIDSYDWNSDTSEMTSRGATYAGEAGRIYVSNQSYGYISGWNYVNGGSPTRIWEWYGAGTTSTSIEDDFGRYNTYSRDSDTLAYSAPYFLMFRSAGNDRTDNPTTGQTVALSAGSATVVAYDPAIHPAGDGNYRGGFDTIGFNALAKNVVTIGSVADAVTSGTRDPSKATVNSFSSWGPTDDGRIKPDLVANGDALYSSLNASNTSYGTYSGTSMATPNAAGSASLLIQYYGQLFTGQMMRSSTLKAMLIHTADDRGNAGPDYRYGWGLINVKAAADLLLDHKNHPLKQHLKEGLLTTTTTSITHDFYWDGVSPIRATLCWTDPAGTATTTSDLRTARLRNNLDLKVAAPNSTQFSPFVMPFVGIWTQAAMDQPATTGKNNTDNVEQVLINTPPAAGVYHAVVSFDGLLTNNQQYYSLIISGSADQSPPPPPLAVTAVTPTSSLPGIVTINLTGMGFRNDTAVKLARTGYSAITGTGVQLIGGTLRCQVNLTGAAAGLWNVVATNPGGETFTLASAFTVIGAIWSENFDGTGATGGWTSQAATGSNSWTETAGLSYSPNESFFAPGPSSKTTTNLVSPVIPIPSGATNLQVKFWHNYNLEKVRADGKDAGVLELSVDGGTNWFDVEASGSGSAFASNGYNTTVKTTGAPSTLSELNGRRSWSGNSGGWVETIVNLTDNAKFAGKPFRMRWRIATDSNNTSTGWYVDSVALLGGGDLTNQPPSITTAATASAADPITTDGYTLVRGASTVLTVAANDDSGESSLTYTWSLTQNVGLPVSFSVNGTNAAKSSTATFESTGDCSFLVTVRDAQGLAATSSVDVRVLQTTSGIIVTPATASIPVGTSQSFGATMTDQFGVAMATQPTSFSWGASGGGTINASGLYTAAMAGGPYVITASNSGFSNTASVTVTPAQATVTLSNLAQTYDGSPKDVTVTTLPAGLTYSVTYDGSAAAPTAAGSYAVEANITNPNYQGSTTGILLIASANDYESWLNDKFTPEEQAAGAAVESADPDHDGFVNLAEYALGIDPHQFSPPLATLRDSEGFSLFFTRPKDLPDVDYAAESSMDLGIWSPALLETLLDGEVQSMRARDPLTTGDTSKRFIRLRLTRH